LSHIVEVRSLSTDHSSQRDQRIDPPLLDPGRRCRGDLERSRHPDELDILIAHAVLPEGSVSPLHQPLHDGLVEASGHQTHLQAPAVEVSLDLSHK
jgi:hypothetical protein